MTPLEQALAAGGKVVEGEQTPLQRALAAGGKVVEGQPPSHDIPVGVRAPEPEQPSRFDNFMSAVGKGANAVGTMATDALNSATNGLYQTGRDAVAGLISPSAAAQTQAAEQGFRDEHPYLAGTGSGLGYFIPGGAPARIAEAASAGVRMATKAAPAAVARVLESRPVAGALTGALTGGGTSAAESAGHGASPADVARDTGRGALLGAGIGAGAGAIGAGAEKARGKLRDPRGEIGRTIKALDEAKASGVTDTPEFKALPKGAEGFNQAATKAEENLAGHNENILREARKRYGSELETYLSDHADRHHVVTETHDLLDSLAAENTVNGEVVDEHLAKAVEKTRRMLTTTTGQLDSRASAEAGGPVYVTAPAVKVPDLIRVKRAVSKLADYGAPATPETRPYRMIDKSLGRELEAVDPRISELNRSYADTMGQLEESNDILYGSQNPDVVRSTSQQKRARGLLGRVGDTTQAATLAASDIERLKGLDPAYRDILSPVEAKKAVERSRYGLPHVSRRMEHLPFALVQQNATALGARVVDPLLGRIAGSAPTGRAANPILDAYEEKRRLDAARSAAAGAR